MVCHCNAIWCPCSGSARFPRSLYEWFFTICSTLVTISFMVDPLSYFSFQPVLHNWCNKGHCMFYPVCGMVHVKEPLLLIGKSNPCGSSRFPLSLSGPLPYVWRHITLNKMCWVRRWIKHFLPAFLSRYLSSPLPYIWRHITVNQICWVRQIKHFLPSFLQHSYI